MCVCVYCQSQTLRTLCTRNLLHASAVVAITNRISIRSALSLYIFPYMLWSSWWCLKRPKHVVTDKWILTVLRVSLWQLMQTLKSDLGQKCYIFHSLIHSFIHSLVFSLRGRVGRNQSPVMWPVWLWHTASWVSSWEYFAIAFLRL